VRPLGAATTRRAKPDQREQYGVPNGLASLHYRNTPRRTTTCASPIASRPFGAFLSFGAATTAVAACSAFTSDQAMAMESCDTPNTGNDAARPSLLTAIALLKCRPPSGDVLTTTCGVAFVPSSQATMTRLSGA